MAREKGMGNLQQEKSGRWTARICVDGKRWSRSTRTKDRAKAEQFLQRMLAPLGLGERTLALADVWREYEKSPNRRDLAPSTMSAKRIVWMHFATWMETNYPAITQLGQLTQDMVAEYLRVLRLHHTASTYNNRVCVIREICHVLAEKASLEDDVWKGVRLLADDSHTRRELTLDELRRVLEAARHYDGRSFFGEATSSSLQNKAAALGEATSSSLQNKDVENSFRSDGDVASPGECENSFRSDGDVASPNVPSTKHKATGTKEWFTLFLIGIHTGLRLGDCCCLQWSEVNLARGIIQVLPRKVRKHLKGRPVTIPIHPELAAALGEATSSSLQNKDVENSIRSDGDVASPKESENSFRSDGDVASPVKSPYVLPTLSAWYLGAARWRVGDGLARIFKAAGIQTSVHIEGRLTATPDATFHSLRHTFVSCAANAGVPLPVVQSIVGHTSTAMTRHYYHENEAELRKAVAAIPSVAQCSPGEATSSSLQNKAAALGEATSSSLQNKECEDSFRSDGDVASPHTTVAERLALLEELKAKGLVTSDEYTTQRQRILSEI